MRFARRRLALLVATMLPVAGIAPLVGSGTAIAALTPVQRVNAGGPVMSPCPNLDCFVPPNEKGSRGTGTPTLTPTMPLVARSPT